MTTTMGRSGGGEAVRRNDKEDEEGGGGEVAQHTPRELEGLEEPGGEGSVLWLWVRKSHSRSGLRRNDLAEPRARRAAARACMTLRLLGVVRPVPQSLAVAAPATSRARPLGGRGA